MPTVPASDDAHDYLPVSCTAVQVGNTYLHTREVIGTVISGTLGFDYWTFTITADLPDGEPFIEGLPWFSDELLEDANTQIRMWRQVPKPPKGTTLMVWDGVTDNSEWIYPAAPDGRYFCYLSGTVAAAGESWPRALIPGLDSVEFEPAASETYDWEFVEDGATVQPGDVVLWDLVERLTVNDILAIDLPIDVRELVFFGQWEGNAVVTWGFPGDLDYVTGGRNAYHEMVAHPAPRALFTARDGSEWIYPGDESLTFLCWSSGTQYAAGARFHRADINAGLRPAE